MTAFKSTFYYTGEMPASHHYFDALGNFRSFELKPTLTLSDPDEIRRAEALVEAGILTESKPKGN